MIKHLTILFLSSFCLYATPQWSMHTNLMVAGVGACPTNIIGNGTGQAFYYRATDARFGGVMMYQFTGCTNLLVTIQLNQTLTNGTTYYFFPKVLNYDGMTYSIILGGTEVAWTGPTTDSDFNRRFFGPI